MPRPSEAILWYFRLFKPYVEEKQLLQNSPEDWSRLQVWDGNGLKPVMPDGFSGIPDEEQINMLYTHMQNKELFFFELGDPVPELVDKGEQYSISRNFAEPTAPQPPQAPNPSKEEQSQYAQAQEEYHYQLTQYQLSKEVFGKYGDRFQAAVNDYHASRNMEQDRQERDAREANSALERTKILRARANRVISEVMAPRPSAPADVFFETEQQGRNATLRFSTYDNQLAPNGYDLPQNSRLSEDEAATINFAMLGVRSEIVKALTQTGNVGPVNAQSAATDDFSYMVTGLFGEPRINQLMADQLGLAMQMGQEAIEQYNGGHPELLGQRLGEAVQNLKTVFTGTGQCNVTQDLVAATKLTERLLGLFSKNPDIWKATGLPDQELDNMRGYVQIGKLYDNYLDSTIKFNAAKAKGTDLSQEEKAEILADTVIRRMVEKELEKDSQLVEDSKEHTDRLEEAAAKDLEAAGKLAAWETENKDKLPQEEFNKQKELMQKLFDYNIHVTFAATQPVEHPILAKLAQPGMLERLRQNLMKDPAILEQAGKSLPEFAPENRTILNQLAEQSQSLVELSRAQAEWNNGFQTMLVQERHNFATDNDRLMIAQTDAKGVKTMVSLSSLLEGSLQALLDPKSNGLDLLYENAKNGNLYFRSTNQGIPTRLNADGGVFSAQPMRRPTLWMRFANTITFGWAYAKECEAAEAYDNYVKATQVSEAVAQKVEEAPKKEATKEQNEAVPAKQAANTQPAKSKRILQPADKTAMEKFFDRLALTEKYMPENSPIKLDGKTAGVLRVMALGSAEVTVKLNQQGDRMANNPDENYKRIIDGHFINRNEPHKGDIAFLQSSWKTLNRALSEATQTGNFSKLGKLIADGLTQNNKVLQAQQRLTDTYTAYATLGGVVLDILKDNPQLEQAVKEHLGPDSKQFEMAKAARNISNLRTEVMPIYQKMLEQFGQTVRIERRNASTGAVDIQDRIAVGGNIRDIAKVAQLFNIDVAMIRGEFKLEGSEYAHDDTVEKYINELNKSDVLRDFLNSRDRITTLQDPIKMRELYTNAVADRQKQIAQQGNVNELKQGLASQQEQPEVPQQHESSLSGM